MLISRPYLNELAVDIAWLEGRLLKASHKFDPSSSHHHNQQAQSRLSSFVRGVSA
jgi:hypothetical protein